MSTPSSAPKLSPTQIGVIGENLLVNAVMKASGGRLSPFKPVADDDGLDVLFFDKETGNSVAIQLKCRTKTDGGGNTAQFDVREATFKEERHAFLVAALLDEELGKIVCSWFISMGQLQKVGKFKTDKYVIRPSKAEGSADKYREFRCANADGLAQCIINECETQSERKK
jgi:hypothetical protein